MKSRPNLYTNYAKETAIFSNNTQKFWFFVLLLLSISLCFVATDYWILLISRSLAFSIGAWGINIVSGLAGQITLAHGSVIGIGVYTAAVLGGVASNSVWGLELDMLIWLPVAGIVAALFSFILSPIAVRLKGLNLALVTLAFLFICSHIFSNFISVTGGAGIGRKSAKLTLLGVNLEEGLLVGNYFLQKNQILYFICLFSCITMGFGFKNLVRSRAGRAYAGIRDGDIAAEALGVNLFRYKASAFALASFYAGVGGSLASTISGGIEPGFFNLLFSILAVAIIVIGGAGTVLGPLFGAFFYVMMPGFIQYILKITHLTESALPLNLGQIEAMLFGLCIILFLIFEPRGLWGIWFRLRNYFKAWPFSY